MSVAFADLASANHYREEPLMRFSVKCDRARAGRIQGAAKAAGVSVESFVQRHFDTILEVGAPSMAPVLDLASDPVRIHRLALREGIAPTYARLALALVGQCAPGTAEFSLSRHEMAALCQTGTRTIQSAMDALRSAGLVRLVDHRGGRVTSRFSLDLDRVLA